MIQLPNTELKVFPIALGTVNAGLTYDGSDADRLFDQFLDLGGNMIDTARIYSDWVSPEKGRSERVIGDWLRREGKRNKIVLATKGGHPNMDSMHASRMGQEDMEHDLDLSLKTLGVDIIDLYFYHRDDIGQSTGELLDRMEGFRKAGKIRYYGCSNWKTGRMLEADTYAKEHSLRGFIANQMLFNIASKYMNPFGDKTMAAMDEAMLRYHLEHQDNTAMPYFGICSGFFHRLEAGKEEELKTSPYYTPENMEIARKIKILREKYHASISQILLGFYFAQDCAMVPLIGPSKAAHLEDAMGSLEIDFDAGDFTAGSILFASPV
jgi:aryl-alcohol dehydrogenase-like predicted oxidoreductase